jgi:hypothetical protein
MAGQRMRFTAAQVRAIVSGAERLGKFPPAKRDAWLSRVAAGGRQGGQAITDLLAMMPADRRTRAAWSRRPSAAVRASAEDAAEDELYESLYPTNEAVAAHAERLAREQAREAQRFTGPGPYDNTLSAAYRAGGLAPGVLQLAAPPADEDADVTHPPVIAAHDHVHSDYGGGVHSHLHTHAGDANHEPGTGNHPHMPPIDPVSEGIAAARRARLRADPADAAAADSDERIFTRLFGPPPGGG